MIRETFKYGLQFGQCFSRTVLLTSAFGVCVRMLFVCVCGAHVCMGVCVVCVCVVCLCVIIKVSGMVSNGCHPLKLHSDPLAFWEPTSCAKSDHPKT